MGKSASTICGAQTVALSTQKTGSKETILLGKRTKGAKGSSKPKAAICKTGVSKNTKKATASITGAMDKKYYRRDLEQGGGEVRASPRLDEDESGEDAHLAL